MTKVQQNSEIIPSFAFTEFDFYKDYEESFKKSELGCFHALLPLREMAIRFGLIDSVPRRKLDRKSYFNPEGKVLLFRIKRQSLVRAEGGGIIIVDDRLVSHFIFIRMYLMVFVTPIRQTNSSKKLDVMISKYFYILLNFHIIIPA